jgi:hypothetical protein
VNAYGASKLAFEQALEESGVREGYALVPDAHKEGDYALGSWVRTQRAQHSKITPERTARLEALPG